jgi:hypothetical protein
VLLPESFAVRVGFFRQSTSEYLSPDHLTVWKDQLMTDWTKRLRPGLHSYDNSYIEVSLLWRTGKNNSTNSTSTEGKSNGSIEDILNVTIATTADSLDPSKLTMHATVNSGNSSDFVLILIPEFTHGRAGIVSAVGSVGAAGSAGSAGSAGISGAAAGMRKRTLGLVQVQYIIHYTLHSILTWLGAGGGGETQQREWAAAPDLPWDLT